MTTLLNFSVGFGALAIIVFLLGSMAKAIEERDWTDDKNTWYSTLGVYMWAIILCVLVMVSFVLAVLCCIEVGRVILHTLFH